MTEGLELKVFEAKVALDFCWDQSFKNYDLVTRGFSLRSHVSIDGGGFLLCMGGFIAPLARSQLLAPLASFTDACLLYSQLLTLLAVAHKRR